MPVLANDTDRAEWLQCLAIAATLLAGELRRIDEVTLKADALYAEYRKRAQR